MEGSKKTSYMSVQSGKSGYSRDSDAEFYEDRKSSVGRKTIADLVRAPPRDPDKRERRKRGVIAPHPTLDVTRSVIDLQYEKYEKDET